MTVVLPILNVASLPVTGTPISIMTLPVLNVPADPVGVTRAVPVTVGSPILNVAALPVTS